MNSTYLPTTFLLNYLSQNQYVPKNRVAFDVTVVYIFTFYKLLSVGQIGKEPRGNVRSSVYANGTSTLHSAWLRLAPGERNITASIGQH